MSFIEMTPLIAPDESTTGRRRTLNCFIDDSATSIPSSGDAGVHGIAHRLRCTDVAGRQAPGRGRDADVAVGHQAEDRFRGADDRNTPESCSHIILATVPRSVSGRQVCAGVLMMSFTLMLSFPSPRHLIAMSMQGSRRLEAPCSRAAAFRQSPSRPRVRICSAAIFSPSAAK